MGKLESWKKLLRSMKKEDQFEVASEDRASLAGVVSKLHTELNYSKKWSIKKDSVGIHCIRIW